MRNFVLNGVELQIPVDCLSEPLIAAIEAGRFEGQEAFAVKKNLCPGDRVLDLGAGTGYLSVLAADIVGADNVVAVEAIPRMIEPLRANLDGNFAAGVAVIHGAVVADSHVGETVNFRTRQAFWASEIAPERDDQSARVSAVPALKIGALMGEHRPSVVILDIEGGEAMLQGVVWPQHVRWYRQVDGLSSRS